MKFLSHFFFWLFWHPICDMSCMKFQPQIKFFEFSVILRNYSFCPYCSLGTPFTKKALTFVECYRYAVMGSTVMCGPLELEQTSLVLITTLGVQLRSWTVHVCPITIITSHNFFRSTSERFNIEEERREIIAHKN